ncbi:monothiol glutaredoxin-S5-like [Dioscorea cayenensis subsp. rotundata]|uniref:Monothiol glutaredoxin-S5-like n=1 Tax=Dioscorea cayennensis subsp. rotundata TaxID=55577 RepID=A0AB40ALC2_DIOCR|nr:monothiol glutaredoxin-S5-like [Dioscorea cayenensis subsp. rotundata]
MEQLLMVAMEEEGVIQIVEGSMVVIVGRRGCCMSYVARRLLEGLKAYLTMCEVSEEFVVKITLPHNIEKIFSGDEKTLVAPMWGDIGWGFRLLIAIHVSGELISKLKTASAIWL